MSDDFIERMADKLPVKQVYDDGVSPAAKQVGILGEELLKTLRLALFPIQFGAALQDRIARFIDKSVRNIPEDRRVAPPPQIIGPVLEGIRYEPEDTPIDKMFSALLSNSMDSEKYDKAHPSFPIIIRQLSGDEAIILAELELKNFSIIETYEKNLQKTRPEEPFWINKKVEKELDFPFEKLNLPGRFSFYTEHLFHLGLACYSENRNQEAIRNADGVQIGTRQFQDYHLMPLGRSLVEACIREN